MSTSGRILRLEVENFKSYKGKHTIGPFDEFTCIIGPNGAGKSNVMDAISFVLGLRAAYMRTSSTKELIFAGDSSSKSTQAKKAYVEMVFEHEGDEYVFRRTVDETGASKYILNDKEVSAGDYDNQLKEFGILTKARNFMVYQGDVEALASKSAPELTKLLEQVSGSDQYKKEYDRLKEERDKASSSVLINIQKKKGVTAEKSQLKMQKKEQKEYNDALDLLAEEQQKYIMWRLYHIEKDIGEQKRHQNEIKQEIEEIKKKGKSLEDQLDKKRKEYAAKRKEHITINRESKDHTQRIQEKETVLGELKVKIQHLKEKLAKSEQSVHKKEEQSKKHSAEEERLKRQLKEAQDKVKEFEDDTEMSQTEEVKLKDQNLEEYRQLKNDVGRLTARDQEELDVHIGQRDALLETKKAILKKIENLENRRRQLNDDIDKAKQRTQKSETATDSADEQLTAKRQELAKIENEKKQLEDNKKKTNDKISDIRDKLRDARIGKKETEREVRFREALDTMKRLFPGVRGRLTDLCTVPNEKYNVAVSVAFGKNTNAIVTDSERTALECITYLKEQRIAAATFLPLDTLKPKRLDEQLRNKTKAKFVLDVLTFDVNLDTAFRYALGNTLVCDTLDAAIDICITRARDIGRQKAVTLDGTVINKSGIMTGGGTSGFESKKKQGPVVDVDALKKQRDACLQDLQTYAREEAALSTRATTIENDIGNLENKIKYIKLDYDHHKKKIEQTKIELKDIEDSLTKSRPELATVEKDLQEITELASEVEERISKVREERFADFNRKIGFDIRTYEGQRDRQKQEERERLAQLKLEVEKLTNILQVVEGRQAKDSVTDLNATIKKDQKSMDDMDKKSKKLDKELEDLRKNAKDIQERLKKAKREMDDKETEMEESKKILKKDVYDILKEKEKALTNRENAIESLRNKRADQVNRCRLEEIELPEVAVEDQQPKKKRKVEEQDPVVLTQSETFSIQTQDEQTQEMQLDFKDLDDDILNLKGKDYDAREKIFVETIEELTARIEHLAPTANKAEANSSAINDRYEKTFSEYEKAKEAAKKVTKDFDEVKKKRYDAFMKAFEPIQSAIDGIYKDLTKSDKFPLGGTAHLGMEEPDEPYLSGIRYNAMPPTKRYRDITQLSGGEKTVAALALLFAIHHFRPSPFFILDEIDAALDNANVTKIGNYVRTRAGIDAQFLVISLKENFFGRADALVGVYRDGKTKSSGVLTYDLKEFADSTTPSKGDRSALQTPSTVGSRRQTPGTASSMREEEDVQQDVEDDVDD